MTTTICLKRRLQIFCVLLCAGVAFFSKVGAKPTLNFSITQGFPSFASLTQQFVEKRSATQMKFYSGKRYNNDSLIMIYYHDQTIAVAELGPEKLLLGCELIEIYNEEEGKKLLNQLAELNRPLMISFSEMLKLMNQCERVDKLNEADNRHPRGSDDERSNKNNRLFPRSPLSILSGIIPGTKWCGTGDIATNFHDLGAENKMDRCCRMHDLCPIKVRAYQTRYDLTNDSLYTKSHCICDDMLFNCLKKTNTSAAQLMGTVYFNLVQVPCLKESGNNYEFRKAREFVI